MSDKTYNQWSANSDKAFLVILGEFLRQNRLQQNKTQVQLAKEAGIARSTLSLVEKGDNTLLIVYIQLLRALNLLHMLKAFEVKPQFSPLQLAKLQSSMRIRASKTVKKINKRKSDW
jgi:transcriptional regulator with XRE-family HTH domain